MNDEHGRLHAAHRDYYLWLAEQANEALLTQAHEQWLDRLQEEDDNLRAALDWSRGQPDGAEALARLVAALQDYWEYVGSYSEGRHWVEEALADRAHVSPRYRIRMLITAGRLALDLTDYQQALALLDESLALARQEGDARAEAEVLSNQGYVVQARGDTLAARALHTEALARWRAIGEVERVADALISLGLTALLLGDLPQSIALFEESIQQCRVGANQFYLTDAILALGFAHFLSGDMEAARTRLHEGLSLARTYATQPLLARGLEEVAFIAGMSGDAERAARLLGAVAAQRARIGLPMIDAYRHFYDQLVERVRGALGDGGMRDHLDAGGALSTEQAIAYALETVRGGA